jgi:hypothetical protein
MNMNMHDVQVGDTFELRAMPGIAWEVLELVNMRVGSTEDRIARLEAGDKWAVESEARLLDERGSWVRAEHVRETLCSV